MFSTTLRQLQHTGFTKQLEYKTSRLAIILAVVDYS